MHSLKHADFRILLLGANNTASNASDKEELANEKIFIWGTNQRCCSTSISSQLVVPAKSTQDTESQLPGRRSSGTNESEVVTCALDWLSRSRNAVHQVTAYVGPFRGSKWARNQVTTKRNETCIPVAIFVTMICSAGAWLLLICQWRAVNSFEIRIDVRRLSRTRRGVSSGKSDNQGKSISFRLWPTVLGRHDAKRWRWANTTR